MEYNVHNLARYVATQYFGYTGEIIPSYYAQKLKELDGIDPSVLRRLFIDRMDFLKQRLANFECESDYRKLCYLVGIVKNISPQAEREIKLEKREAEIASRKTDYVLDEQSIPDNRAAPKDISAFLDEEDL